MEDETEGRIRKREKVERDWRIGRRAGWAEDGGEKGTIREGREDRRRQDGGGQKGGEKRRKVKRKRKQKRMKRTEKRKRTQKANKRGNYISARLDSSDIPLPLHSRGPEGRPIQRFPSAKRAAPTREVL